VIASPDKRVTSLVILINSSLTLSLTSNILSIASTLFTRSSHILPISTFFKLTANHHRGAPYRSIYRCVGPLENPPAWSPSAHPACAGRRAGAITYNLARGVKIYISIDLFLWEGEYASCSSKDRYLGRNC